MPGRRDHDELSRVIDERVRETLARAFGGGRRLPDGVVTVLFTDVEGSADLVRTQGDHEARAMLREHDARIRRAVEAHDGTEVERAGDSFMVAFRLPSLALGCALAIHRALEEPPADRPLRVRIGMDTGEAIVEEEGYFGRTVFRASRIAGLASGGETLASEATKVLGEPMGYTFGDLGEHALKGLGGGHRLFRLLSGPSER